MNTPGFDQVIGQRFHWQPHTEKLTAETFQPTEDLILARNAELRKNPGSLNDLGQGNEGGSWGRQVATIPEIMFNKAIKDGFDLMSTDTQRAAREMQRFLASTEGKMCLVQDQSAKANTKYFKGI